MSNVAELNRQLSANEKIMIYARMKMIVTDTQLYLLDDDGSEESLKLLNISNIYLNRINELEKEQNRLLKLIEEENNK